MSENELSCLTNTVDTVDYLHSTVTTYIMNAVFEVERTVKCNPQIL